MVDDKDGIAPTVNQRRRAREVESTTWTSGCDERPSGALDVIVTPPGTLPSIPLRSGDSQNVNILTRSARVKTERGRRPAMPETGYPVSATGPGPCAMLATAATDTAGCIAPSGDSRRMPACAAKHAAANSLLLS